MPRIMLMLQKSRKHWDCLFFGTEKFPNFGLLSGEMEKFE